MKLIGDLVSKAKDLKGEYDANRRAAKADALSQLEIELGAREKAVREHEQRLALLEKELGKKRKRMRWINVACVTAGASIGVLGLLIAAGSQVEPGASEASVTRAPAKPKPTGSEDSDIAAAAKQERAENPVTISVPTDPRATYTWLYQRSEGEDFVYVIDRRDGPSGTSYAKRQANCSDMTFRYIGDSDTLRGLPQSRSDPKLAPLVHGSISYYVVQFACDRRG